MAYENFKPTIWSKFIQLELEKRAILLESCWKKFSGEVEHAQSVKILGVGDPTIGQYTGGDIGAPEEIADSSVTLIIDQAPYFNFAVDDIDKAQSVPGLMEAMMTNATRKMALEVDSFIAKQALDAGKISASTEVKTADGAKAAIDAALLALHENDVQIDDNIVIEIPFFVYMLLRDKYIDLDTNNTAMLKNGVVGKYMNAVVKTTNNLYSDGTDEYAMVRTPQAVAFAQQIQKVEPYKIERGFKDAVKGLNLFGAKVVRPKELYAIRVHKG